MASFRVFCLGCAAWLCTSSVLGQGLPDDLSDRWLRELKRIRESKYVEEERYDEAERLVREAHDAATSIAALHALTQLMFDHDRGNDWVTGIAEDLEDPAMQHVGYDSVPDTLMVDHIVLKDGRELFGTGGSLVRHFPHSPMNRQQERRYLQPNFGIDGIGSFWIASESWKKFERTPIPAPKAFLRASYLSQYDEQGRWVMDGLWFLPGKGQERLTIALDVVDRGSGGTLLVNEEYAIRCVRRSPETLVDRQVSPNRTMSGRPTNAQRTVQVAELKQTVARLRESVRNVSWWYEPFRPDEEALAAAAARQDEWLDDDPTESLLRLRFLLTYGDDLPALALEKPRLMLEIERRVLAALRGGELAAVERLTRDWRVVAAAIRRAPSEQAAPDPGGQGENFVAFPESYTPWRRSPLLLALHGQYCQPAYDFDVWREHAERAGMILLCPRYGSTRGTPANQESDRQILDQLRYYCLHYNIDPDRIYLTGLSMGGATSWKLGMAYPSQWAAVAPEIHGPRVINKSVPRLRNLLPVPMFVLEGEFDSLNTVYSRQAIKKLERWKATVRYHEATWFGHSRLTWMYPDVIDFFQAAQRDAHPALVEHRSFHAYVAESSWLAIRDLKHNAAWHRTDGSYSLVDLTGVKATYKNGTIDVRRVEGKPSRVEIFYDDRLMADELKIRAKGKTRKWKPEPSIERMLMRARHTGEREQVYGAWISVDL